MTVVLSVAELLPVLASCSGLRLRRFVSVPAVARVAWTVMVSVEPLAIEPSEQRTLPPDGAAQLPFDVVIAPIVTPAPLGSVSSTCTAAAASGPSLCTVSV